MPGFLQFKSSKLCSIQFRLIRFSLRDFSKHDFLSLTWKYLMSTGVWWDGSKSHRRSSLCRLKSGISRIFELSAWNLNNSDCGASKIVQNYTKFEPIFWELNFVNLLLPVWKLWQFNGYGIVPEFSVLISHESWTFKK